MEAVYELLSLLVPLYVSGIYNAVKLSQIAGKQDNCVYCQKSKEIIKREIEKITEP